MKIREHRNTKAWAVTHAHIELDSVTAKHILGDEFTETREHGDGWPAGRMITAFIRTTRFSSCVWYVLCSCFCLSVCYTVLCDTRTRTHHLFNYPLSWTTRVSWYQSFSEWQWHQLGHMQVCTSLQTDNHASTPPLSFFTGRMPFLPPNQQRQSTESTVWDEINKKCKPRSLPPAVISCHCRCRTLLAFSWRCHADWTSW